MRRILGIVAGMAVAALGAVILGEYPFNGLVVLGSGLLFGLLVAEAVVAAGGERGPVPAVAAALASGAGLVWAGWISEGHELGRLAVSGWAAVALGVAAAGFRARSPRARTDNPTGPAPPP